jgi:putrescine transport system permease protein
MEVSTSKKHYLIIGVGCAFLYIPILCLVISSFFYNGEISFYWYKVLLSKKKLIDSFFQSLKVSYISASFATFIGLILSMLTRMKKNFFLGMSVVPIFIPEAVLGLSFLILFNSLSSFSIDFSGFYRVIIAHTTLSISYTSMIIKSAIEDMDSTIEEAALDLGARQIKVFLNITFPIIAKSVLVAWLISFLISLDDIVLVSFVSTPDICTLPMLIFSTIRLGISPEMSALSTIFVVFVFSTSFIVWKTLRKTIRF